MVGFRDQVAELQRAMGASGTSLQIVTALDEVRRASAGGHVRACLPSAQRSGVRCGGAYRVVLGYSVLRAVPCCVISARPRPHRVFFRGTLRARRAPRRAAGRHAPTVRRGISIVRFSVAHTAGRVAAECAWVGHRVQPRGDLVRDGSRARERPVVHRPVRRGISCADAAAGAR